MPLRQSMFARSTLKQLVPVAFRGAARQQTNGANKLQVGIDHDSVSTFCDLPCWSSNNPIVPVSHWGREAEDTVRSLFLVAGVVQTETDRRHPVPYAVRDIPFLRTRSAAKRAIF